jgi:hypothetical protein
MRRPETRPIGLPAECVSTGKALRLLSGTSGGSSSTLSETEAESPSNFIIQGTFTCTRIQRASSANAAREGPHEAQGRLMPGHHELWTPSRQHQGLGRRATLPRLGNQEPKTANSQVFPSWLLFPETCLGHPSHHGCTTFAIYYRLFSTLSIRFGQGFSQDPRLDAPNIFRRCPLAGQNALQSSAIGRGLWSAAIHRRFAFRDRDAVGLEWDVTKAAMNRRTPKSSDRAAGSRKPQRRAVLCPPLHGVRRHEAGPLQTLDRAIGRADQSV